jgi:hypothetical protein
VNTSVLGLFSRKRGSINSGTGVIGGVKDTADGYKRLGLAR